MSYPPEWRLALRNGGSPSGMGAPTRSVQEDCQPPRRALAAVTRIAWSVARSPAQDFPEFVGRGCSLARNARGGSGIAGCARGHEGSAARGK